MVMQTRYRRIYNNKIKQLAVRYADIGDSLVLLKTTTGNIIDVLNNDDDGFTTLGKLLERVKSVCHNLLSNPLFTKTDAPVRIPGYGGYTWVSAIEMLLDITENCSNYLKHADYSLGQAVSELRNMDIYALFQVSDSLNDTWKTVSKYRDVNPLDIYS